MLHCRDRLRVTWTFGSTAKLRIQESEEKQPLKYRKNKVKKIRDYIEQGRPVIESL